MPKLGKADDEGKNLLDVMLKENVAIIADYYVAQHLMYDYYIERRRETRGYDEKIQCPFVLSKKPVFWRSQAFVYDCKTQLNFLFDPE